MFPIVYIAFNNFNLCRKCVDAPLNLTNHLATTFCCISGCAMYSLKISLYYLIKHHSLQTLENQNHIVMCESALNSIDLKQNDCSITARTSCSFFLPKLLIINQHEVCYIHLFLVTKFKTRLSTNVL